MTPDDAIVVAARDVNRQIERIHRLESDVRRLEDIVRKLLRERDTRTAEGGDS